MKNRLYVSLLSGVIFFVIGFLTITHYGINWDTINHLPRGQAYLHYFLTGKKDYSDLPKFKRYFQDPDKILPATNSGDRSFYQNDAVDFNYFMSHDGDGHPPLSDILSAVFNRVLFGKLHIVNDVDSYRVYGLLLASITVGLVCFWIWQEYGGLAAAFSSLFLATYPLFWSESHFNTEKDIPETAFWTMLLFFIYKAITQKRLKWYLASGLALGLALGTKFNIFFSSLVILPWLIFYIVKNKVTVKNILLTSVKLLGVSLIGFIIFVASWPYLWQDILDGLAKVFGFYKTIGTTSTSALNFYPIEWITFTTNPLVLIFLVIGTIFLIKQVSKSKSGMPLILLLWLAVPIVRVTMPGSTIYGGVRQIMEYIPALAIIAGIGFSKVLSNFKSKLLRIVIILSTLIVLFYPLIKTHPNENTYFNFLIGGLSGAKSQNLQSWGNSFGAAYRQAVSWINKNAPDKSNVTLTYELLPNIPDIWFRDDINYHNSMRSGYLMKGEYSMTLTYQGLEDRSYYDNFLQNFINPVFEVKPQGVPILKVWKNEKEYLNRDLNEKIIHGSKLTKTKSSLTFDLGNKVKLSRLEASYIDNNCSPLEYGLVKVSNDAINWKNLPGTFPDDWRISFLGAEPKDGYFIEPFVGQEARYIQIDLKPVDTCLFRILNYRVFYFDY